MRLSPIIAFRDAVIGLLKASPNIQAVCAGRVYDVVPTTGALAALPHISCGPANVGRGENGGDPLGLIRLRLFVASREPLRDEVWSIAQAITDVLDGAEPALSGGWHLIDLVRVMQSGDVLDRAAPNEVFLDIASIVERDVSVK